MFARTTVVPLVEQRRLMDYVGLANVSVIRDSLDQIAQKNCGCLAPQTQTERHAQHMASVIMEDAFVI